jgi:hypothetical protein
VLALCVENHEVDTHCYLATVSSPDNPNTYYDVEDQIGPGLETAIDCDNNQNFTYTGEAIVALGGGSDSTPLSDGKHL